ncbi:MAG TPA: hypothetical protein VF767_05435 [Bryobacteraceae bacterium]
MIRKFALFCLCCCSPAAAWAQSGIVAPRAGCVRDRAGTLRTVFGMAGTFLPGQAVRTEVVSAACSEQLAVAKTAGALEVRDASMRLLGRWAAPAGPARFAFSRCGGAVYVYFPETGGLTYYETNRGLRRIPLPNAFGGEALAIAAPDAQHLSAVVRGRRGLRLVRVLIPRTLVEQDLPLEDIAGPMLLGRDGTLVYTEAEEVVIRKPNQAERRLALPAQAAAIEQMGEDLAAIALVNRAAPAALRWQEGREQVLRVPEAAE